MFPRHMAETNIHTMSLRKAHTPTTLQSFCIVALIALCMGVSVNAMVTHGSDRTPSGTMFSNSQTMEIL